MNKLICILIAVAALAASIFAFLPFKNDKITTELPDPDESEAQAVTTGSAESNTKPATTVPVTSTALTVKPTAAETTTTPPEEDEWRYRGLISDSNNRIIVYSEDSVRKFEDKYSESLANVLDSYNSALGIDRVFEETLRMPNPTVSRSENGFLFGRSLVLTLDAELHTEIYAYMSSRDLIGSLVVLNGNGEVKALVSTPSYDANADFTSLKNLQPHACLNRCVEGQRPGSTFKLLSSVIASEYNISSLPDLGTWNDTSNWDTNGVPYPEVKQRTLREALVFSSNCWYARLFYDLGSEKVLESLDKHFDFSSPVRCDFVTLENTINVSTIDDLTRSGYGQRQNISPLSLGMFANAVVTQELNTPYIAEKTVDTVTWDDIETLSEKKTVNIIPKELTEEVKLGMLDISENLGLTLDNGMKIYSKTGTAEVSDDGSKNLHYIVSVITDDKCDPDNTTAVVFQLANSEFAYASGDAPDMQKILDIIFK